VSQLISRPVDWIFALLALAFVLSLGVLPYPGDFLLKVSPIVCLIIAVALSGTKGRQRLVIAALVFCGIGDVSLETGHFSFGLGAFLIGHLFYLAVFCRGLRLTASRALILAGILAYGAGLMNFLTPHLGEMKFAVWLYMSIIFSMTAAAVTGRDNHVLVAFGAVLFVVSDSLIAINRFVEPLPGARYWIMVLYYSGQYFLTWQARTRSAP